MFYDGFQGVDVIKEILNEILRVVLLIIFGPLLRLVWILSDFISNQMTGSDEA